jgi:hypothetical protein
VSLELLWCSKVPKLDSGYGTGNGYAYQMGTCPRGTQAMPDTDPAGSAAERSEAIAAY